MMKSRITIICLLSCTFLFSPARTTKVKGTVTNSKGEPLSNIVVSDGFTSVRTGKDGRYCFERNKAAYYVHYSIPSEYEIPIRNGQPVFYKKLERDSVYDFILTPKKKGAEKKFTLFLIADPQCMNVRHVRRFHCETIPDIRKSAKKTRIPNYGITLGDISYTEGEFNTSFILPLMKEEMETQNMTMPVFQTVGNHDHISEGLATDELNPTPMIRYKRMFEDIFGPVNYSWNRGNAHIITMDNVMYDVMNKASKYHGEFTAEQLSWLEKDLSYVPKDKLIILCVHIPIYSTKNKEAILGLLNRFENRVIFSGHIHTNTSYIHPDGTKEYNLAAASGTWWRSRLNGDGTPNGYKIVTIEGNRIVNQVWKGSELDKNFQIRLYRGDSRFGGSYEEFQLSFGKETILANVFGWEEGWKVQIYEDGKLQGEMRHMKPTGKEDQTPSLQSSKDWWAIGYHVGVLGRGHIMKSNRNSYINSCKHMFVHKLKNPDAKVKVVATDPYGNTYTQTDIIEGNALETGSTIYESATPPAYPKDPVWN